MRKLFHFIIFFMLFVASVAAQHLSDHHTASYLEDTDGEFELFPTQRQASEHLKQFREEFEALMEAYQLGHITDKGVLDIDSLALVTLYNNTDGTNWNYNDNWLEGPIQTWYGVTVENGRVTKLELFFNQLKGELPAELGNLSHLRILNLYDNFLSGEIPAELGNLLQLREIWVHLNGLTGNIPLELNNWVNLEILYINDNKLTGTIPAGWKNFSKLIELYANNNNLTGQLPVELAELENSRLFNFSWNQLTGEIPAEYGNLKNLYRLCLNNNQLSGNIPAELGNLVNLRNFFLYQNNLSGEIPAELGNLVNLRSLWVEHNNLSGKIPSSLGSIPYLQSIRLHNNNLNGEIPSSLSNLSYLQFLSLEHNQLSGTIPESLGDLVHLKLISLAHNNLSGKVPGSLNNIRGLRQLFLSHNYLSGSFPSLDYPNLTNLRLEHNRLETIPELSKLVKLQQLSIEENNLGFKEILVNMDLADDYTFYPQNPIGKARVDTLVHNTRFVIDLKAEAQGNVYSWYRDNQLMGSDDATFVIDTVTYQDAAEYHLEIENPALPEMTIISFPVQLVVISSMDIYQPVPVAPEDQAMVSIPFDLSWNGHQNDREYRLQISLKSDFIHTYTDTIWAANLNSGHFTVNKLPFPDQVYYWRLRASAFGVIGNWSETRSFTSDWTVVDLREDAWIPATFELKQNYPNPFNPTTRIGYNISQPGHVRLEVFNILGQPVATLVNEGKNPGFHEIDFNASGFSSGVYIYRLSSGGFIQSRILMLLK